VSRWKAAEATPLVASDAFALRPTVAPRVAPGSVSEPLGLVLSTVTVRTGLVNVLPATSLVTTRRSYEPSVSPAVSRLVWKGDPLTVAIVVHEPTPAGRALEDR